MEIQGEPGQYAYNKLYVMEDKADDVLNSFGLSEDERKVYRTVKEKVDNYFEAQCNVIFQHAKFNQ